MYRLLAIVALCWGCTPTSYAFTPSARGSVSRAEGCEFQMLDAAPSESFEEIGELTHYNGDVPKTVEAFKKAIADRVCEVGGDAVVTDADPSGYYRKGTVIKLNRR